MERIKQILQFLEDSPKDNFLVHALALEYVKAGNDKEARTLFEQNLYNSPSYIATYYHLGKLLDRNNETEQAIAIYQKGMQQATLVNDQHAFSELRSVYEELIF